MPLQGWLCAPGPTVPPTGELQGNCAFASLLRSSGAAFSSPRAEKAACGVMRRAVVAANLRRLLTEPDFVDTVAAVNASSDGGAGGSGVVRDVASGRATGRKPRRGGLADADAAATAAAEGLDPTARGVLSYLQGQLSCSPALASQYAGPLELAALAGLLQRDILIFAERGSADDGAVFTPEQLSTADGLCGDGAGGAGVATGSQPPLAAVNTRRRHMYPLVFRPLAASATTGGATPHAKGVGSKPSRGAAETTPAGTSAITQEQLTAVLSRAVSQLTGALEKRRAATNGGDDALGAAVAQVLRDIEHGTTTPL